MTQTVASCGPVGSVLDLIKKHPALFLPATLFTIACVGSAVAYVPTKDTCDNGADKVAVVDGTAHWVGKWGEVAFGVANKPTPKDVCVIVLDKEDAMAFNANNSLAWDDFNKWKNQG